MLKITRGKIQRAQRVVIYGPEGIGKSSLAVQFPDPLVIDTEGGTAHMDIRRIDKPQSWEELLSIVKEVAVTRDLCRTLVIDTADWAEQLIIRHVCERYKQDSIESFGYGKGYTYVSEEFARFLSCCDRVIDAGMHVVITAHAQMRKFEQPDEMGAFDRWEMKLSKKTAPLLKEWCDFLFFCNYQTFAVTSENDTKKAQGGKRVMYTAHHPTYDAKRRVPLPDVMDLDYEGIAPIFEAPQRTACRVMPQEKLRFLMVEDGVTEEELRSVVAARGHYPPDTPTSEYPDSFVSGWLLRYWDQILDLIRTDGTDTTCMAG